METPDSTEILLKLALLAGIICFNIFFVLAEFALVKVRSTALDELIRKGSRAAQQAKLAVTDMDSSLSTCQLGVTLASLALGWVGEPVVSALLSPVFNKLGVHSTELRHTLSVVFGFSALTYIHIVLGEQVPKMLAISHALQATLFVAPALRWFQKITWPFVWLLRISSTWAMARLGLKQTSEGGENHTHEELRLLLTSSNSTVNSTALGRDIILNALELSRRRARDVMRPRQEITVIDTSFPLEKAVEIAEKTRFSRFPLCLDGDLDRVIGVVHFKDLYASRHRTGTALDLGPAARSLVYVPPTARLERVLQILLERKVHMAFVIDEYGGTIGLVTLENVLEELVGQIQDEFDHERPLLEKTSQAEWRVDGALPLHELAELTGEALSDPEIVTVSGWMTLQLGGFPQEGQSVEVGPFTLAVKEMTGTMIREMVLSRRPTGGETDSP